MVFIMTNGQQLTAPMQQYNIQQPAMRSPASADDEEIMKFIEESKQKLW